MKLSYGVVELDEETVRENREVSAVIEQALAGAPPVHAVDPEETRRARREGRGLWPAPVFVDAARDVTIEGREGPVRLRVLEPPGAKAAYLHLHGGGWALGSADQADPMLWELAQSAGVVVVSVDYRLAPEHPFPAGPDDCEDAARWLLDEGPERFGVEGIVVGGESAGAHLAVLTLLRLRDAGVSLRRFLGANLVYGVYDLAMTPSQRGWGTRNLVLSTPTMAWFYDLFLPGVSEEERRSPDVSPLYADLTGMPSALFTVGTADPLLDDTLFMEARWRMAGGETTLRVYPEGLHGFNGFATRMGARANEEQRRFIAERSAGGDEHDAGRGEPEAGHL